MLSKYKELYVYADSSLLKTLFFNEYAKWPLFILDFGVYYEKNEFIFTYYYSTSFSFWTNS